MMRQTRSAVGWLFMAGLFGLLATSATGSSLLSLQGTRSYVIRRLYQPGQTQKYNISYTLQADMGTPLLEQKIPVRDEALLEIETRILGVEANGVAKMRFTIRYKKQVRDYLKEDKLPVPITQTVRITPSGFPAKEEAKSKFNERQSDNADDTFPGIPVLPDLGSLLTLFSLDVGIPGPFAPLPPSAVSEGDQWHIERPTPFINTRGGQLALREATLYTYPSTVKVIGKKTVRDRPVLQVQETYDQEVNIPIGDTLLEFVRLEGRAKPKGTIKGRVKCTTDYYYALSDGALVQAEGTLEQNLRAEYDRDTVAEWEADEPWAEWGAKTTFRQVLADTKAAAPPKKK